MNKKASHEVDGDSFDLERFTRVQEASYEDAIAEIKAGRKRSHWMWYIFPQLQGLGRSELSKRYAIESIEEAQAYLCHPILGTRLRECAEAALALHGRSTEEIFGFPDNLKLKSCMTLFLRASDSSSVFAKVLKKYFDGKQDAGTLKLLEAHQS